MIAFLITHGGIGFAPGSTQYLPTLGFSIGAAIALQHDTWRQQFTILRRIMQQFEF